MIPEGERPAKVAGVVVFINPLTGVPTYLECLRMDKKFRDGIIDFAKYLASTKSSPTGSISHVYHSLRNLVSEHQVIEGKLHEAYEFARLIDVPVVYVPLPVFFEYGEVRRMFEEMSKV
jgi:hypothetical protein